MAATETSFGVGDWGISQDQSGIILESYTYDYSNSNKVLKDRTGNTSGITYYDEKISISINGRIPKTSPFSTTLAASLTLSNPVSSYLKGGVASGLVLVEGITLDSNQEDYKAIKITATKYPNILI